LFWKALVATLEFLFLSLLSLLPILFWSFSFVFSIIVVVFVFFFITNLFSLSIIECFPHEREHKERLLVVIKSRPLPPPKIENELFTAVNEIVVVISLFYYSSLYYVVV